MIEQYFDNPAHRASEATAIAAERAQRGGAADEAALGFGLAARLEESAALLVPLDVPRVRTLLAISAASLWMKAGDVREGARCAAAFLRESSGLTPDGTKVLDALVRDARTELDARDRIDALRRRPAPGRSSHELRLVPSDHRQTGRDPATVVTAIRRWDALCAATGAPANDVEIAAMAAGSLRVLFTASERTHKQIVARYVELASSRDGHSRFMRRLGDQATAAAYFELVNFLATSRSSLELALSELDDATVRVNVLTWQQAEAQRAVLAVPTSETKHEKFVARVTSASITRSMLELERDGQRTEGHVTGPSRSALTGLRIGHKYEFRLTMNTTKETPAARPRIEFAIEGATPEVMLAPSNARTSAGVTPPRRRHAARLVWSKKLAATDALQNPGNARAYVQLTRGGYPIDHRTWFRDELFGDLDWEKIDAEEHAVAYFKVCVLSVRLPGLHGLRVTHDPSRSIHRSQPTTRLYWDDELRGVLTENDATAKHLVLEREENGELRLRISESAPT
jgi:hypothetical protein